MKYHPKLTIKSQSKDHTIFAEINSRIWGDNDSNLAAYLKTAFQDSSLQWLEYFFPALIQRVFQCRTTKLLSQKRRHLAIFCISFLWQRGTHPEKKKRLLSQKKSHLAVFCIDRTAMGCYDFVRIFFDTRIIHLPQSSWEVFSKIEDLPILYTFCTILFNLVPES